MNLALRSAFATLALCFAGCATTTTHSIAAHGPGVRMAPAIAMVTPTRTTTASYEQPAALDRAISSPRVVDRGIPMPEPAREAMHALPTPQVPIPFQPVERTMPSFSGRSGGNAAYWQ